MVLTKIAIALGVLALGFGCFLALLGVNAASEGIVTLVVLVVLVAGGNLLAGRGSYVRRRAEVLEPRRLPQTWTGAAQAPAQPFGEQQAQSLTEPPTTRPPPPTGRPTGPDDLPGAGPS
jgi:hypothetical protein